MATELTLTDVVVAVVGSSLELQAVKPIMALRIRIDTEREKRFKYGKRIFTAECK